MPCGLQRCQGIITHGVQTRAAYAFAYRAGLTHTLWRSTALSTARASAGSHRCSFTALLLLRLRRGRHHVDALRPHRNSPAIVRRPAFVAFEYALPSRGQLQRFILPRNPCLKAVDSAGEAPCSDDFSQKESAW